MDYSSFMARWFGRMGVGILLAGSATAQDEADPSNPAMEIDSIGTEASAVATDVEMGASEAAVAPADEGNAGMSPQNGTVLNAEESQASGEDAEFGEGEFVGEVEVIDLQESALYDETWDSSAKGQPGQDISGQVSVEEIVEPSGEYHYAAFGRPNPFLPPRVTETASPLMPPTAVKPGGEINIAGTEIPVVSALQTYPLDRLELKGIWQLQSGAMRAIVMTPEKEGIIVKANDPISAGKVLSIAKDFIMVRQYRLRPDGTREFSDERLNLGRGYGGLPQGSVKLTPGKDPEFSTPKAREEMNATPPPPPVGAAAVPAVETLESKPKDGKAAAVPAVK